MSKSNALYFTTGVIGYPIVFVLLLWLVFWVEIRFGLNFTPYGVYPRTVSGLKGILFSPFIHSGITHLYHNTIPVFVLSMALFYFYRGVAWQILGLGILISGSLTWLIGRPSFHIGASGVVYVLVSFIFFKGVFAKHYRLIALSLVIVFLYGSLLWYVFPVKEGVSWEGHLSGLIAGLVLALYFKNQILKVPKYEWETEDYNEEEDEFLKHFDADGNFIEHIEPDHTEDDSVDIVYHYSESKPKNKTDL